MGLRDPLRAVAPARGAPLGAHRPAELARASDAEHAAALRTWSALAGLVGVAAAAVALAAGADGRDAVLAGAWALLIGIYPVSCLVQSSAAADRPAAPPALLFLLGPLSVVTVLLDAPSLLLVAVGVGVGALIAHDLALDDRDAGRVQVRQGWGMLLTLALLGTVGGFVVELAGAERQRLTLAILAGILVAGALASLVLRRPGAVRSALVVFASAAAFVLPALAMSLALPELLLLCAAVGLAIGGSAAGRIVAAMRASTEPVGSPALVRRRLRLAPLAAGAALLVAAMIVHRDAVAGGCDSACAMTAGGAGAVVVAGVFALPAYLAATIVLLTQRLRLARAGSAGAATTPAAPVRPGGSVGGLALPLPAVAGLHRALALDRGPAAALQSLSAQWEETFETRSARQVMRGLAGQGHAAVLVTEWALANDALAELVRVGRVQASIGATARLLRVLSVLESDPYEQRGVIAIHSKGQEYDIDTRGVKADTPLIVAARALVTDADGFEAPSATDVHVLIWIIERARNGGWLTDPPSIVAAIESLGLPSAADERARAWIETTSRGLRALRRACSADDPQCITPEAWELVQDRLRLATESMRSRSLGAALYRYVLDEAPRLVPQRSF